MKTRISTRKQLSPSIFSLLLFMTALAVSSQQLHPPYLMVKVVDLDQGTGVESDVCLDTNYPDCPSSARIGSTNSSGEWRAQYSCRPKDKVFARPVANGYYSSRKLPCMPTVFQVSSTKTATVLEEIVAKATREGKFGQAALVANELVVRLSDVDPKKAAQYEMIAYQSTAKVFDVSAATVADQDQHKAVMSPALKDKVAAFQTKKSIYSPTDQRLGRLDYQTLSGLAGTSLSSTVKAYSPAK